MTLEYSSNVHGGLAGRCLMEARRHMASVHVPAQDVLAQYLWCNVMQQRLCVQEDAHATAVAVLLLRAGHMFHLPVTRWEFLHPELKRANMIHTCNKPVNSPLGGSKKSF